MFLKMKLIWIRAFILNHNLVLLYDKVHSFGMSFQVGTIHMLQLAQNVNFVPIHGGCVGLDGEDHLKTLWLLVISLGSWDNLTLTMAGVALPYVVQTASA